MDEIKFKDIPEMSKEELKDFLPKGITMTRNDRARLICIEILKKQDEKAIRKIAYHLEEVEKDCLERTCADIEKFTQVIAGETE